MKIKFLLFLTFCTLTTTAIGGAVSPVLTKISYLRPYSSGDIYVVVSNSSLCGTDVFRIAYNLEGREQMYSAVLSALMSQNDIRIEVSNSTGCIGWGTTVESIYIYPPS